MKKFLKIILLVFLAIIIGKLTIEIIDIVSPKLKKKYIDLFSSNIY